MAGGEVQADAVLERRVRLVVQVDPDVVRGSSASSSSARRRRPRAARRARLRRREHLLAVLGRAADEQDPRLPGSARRAVEAVGHRQRQRAPDRQDASAVGAISGSNETKRSNVVGVDRAARPGAAPGRGARPAASRGIGSVRKPSVAAPRPANGPGGDDLGPEDDDDVRRERARPRRSASGVAAARNSKKRVSTRRGCRERAGLEERRLPDEGEPQRAPRGRRWGTA